MSATGAMTGGEHYAEAERLVAFINSEENAIPEQRIAHAALAQVHATLALVAQVHELMRPRAMVSGRGLDDRRAAEMQS